MCVCVCHFVTLLKSFIFLIFLYEALCQSYSCKGSCDHFWDVQFLGFQVLKTHKTWRPHPLCSDHGDHASGPTVTQPLRFRGVAATRRLDTASLGESGDCAMKGG